jgi:hypothetical protein
LPLWHSTPETPVEGGRVMSPLQSGRMACSPAMTARNNARSFGLRGLKRARGWFGGRHKASNAGDAFAFQWASL